MFPLRCPVADCKAEMNILTTSNTSTRPTGSLKSAQMALQYYRLHTDKMVQCPMLTCKSRVFFQGQSDFYCTYCYNRYCLRCRSKLHPGQTCEQVKKLLTTEELNGMFELVKMGAVFKACPACQRWNAKVGAGLEITRFMWRQMVFRMRNSESIRMCARGQLFY